MKHLLDSIESRALDLSHTGIDITQLLTNVRDTRDTKSVEGFTEAMDKVLHELRSTEHAIPFLKPVKRSEAPNYDSIIKEPMDLYSMAQKVRKHTYKSKREFVNDLNLIWDNCLTYNSEPTHPLRRSTVFMRKKAEAAVQKYLGNHLGGDQRNGSGPAIPLLNGNGGAFTSGGHGHHHSGLTNGNTSLHDNLTSPKIRIKLQTPKAPSRAKSEAFSISPDDGRNGSTHTKRNGHREHDKSKSHHRTNSAASRIRGTPFAETTAIIRTPQSMKQYYDLDYAMQPHLDSEGAGPSKPPGHPSRNGPGPGPANTSAGAGYLSVERTDGVLTAAELRTQLDEAIHGDPDHPDDAALSLAYKDGLLTGTFRGPKRRVLQQGEDPSNRPQKRPRIALTPEQAAVQAGLIQDSQLLGAWWGAMASNTFLGNGAPPLVSEPPAIAGPARGAKKSKRKRKLLGDTTKPKELPGLKGAIFKNVDSLRRIRRTHAALLAASTSSTAVNEEDEPRRIKSAPRKPDSAPLAELEGRHDSLSIPIEGGSKLAATLLKRNCAHLLEHSGFEGSSSRALDTLAHVAGEFMMNMGRTLSFLTSQRPLNMTPEELILHTLSESGIPEVRRLDGYIRDDVERYGGRLGDLERKLTNAWQDEVEANEEVEYDEGLADDGEALIAGDFSSALGDDFFGLRELGLEKEFGLSSLSVPARLFHGRAKKDASGAGNGDGAGSGPKEPALPFPPPKPFIPLNSHKLDSQIGLLRGYYRGKFDKARDSNGHAPPPPAPPMLNGAPAEPPAPPPPFDYTTAPPVSLQDDQPSLLRMKMGPNGQVSVPTSAAAASAAARKKKAAAAGADAGGTTGANGVVSKGKAAGGTGAKSTVKKKPPKSSSSPKKPIITNGTGPPPPQAPPAILAS